jgi:hypothetical protein
MRPLCPDLSMSTECCAFPELGIGHKRRPELPDLDAPELTPYILEGRPRTAR